MTLSQLVRRMAAACLILTALTASLCAQPPVTSGVQPPEDRQPGLATNAAAYLPGELKFTRSDEVYPITSAQPAASYSIQSWKVAVLHVKGLELPGSRHLERMKQIPIPQARLNGLIHRTDKSLLPNADVVTFFRQAGPQSENVFRSGRQQSPFSHVFYRRLDPQPEDPSGPNSQAEREQRMYEAKYGVKYERGEFEFVILAPPDRIEELARALLILLNQGDAIPARNKVVESLKTAKEQLQQAEAALEQARQRHEQAEAKWKEVEGLEQIATATLTELKTKRALLSVERAGILARIQAVERMAGAQQQPHLLALKSASEIDLAG
ncbi:MAG: hypothetical protein HY000_37455, partial [Planctomycetes bacterium]|nr:hypothetical protein [Planctomycetota bacterium]